MGTFFPDLIVSVSALFFLFYVFKNKEFYFFKNKPLIIFFIFCTYCIFLSIFVAEDMMLSFESSLFYFRIGIFCCFIWYLIEKDKNISIFFYHVLVLCFLILVIDGYFQYFNDENLLGFKMINTRVSSFLVRIDYGIILIKIIPFVICFIFKKKKKKFEIYFIGLLFVLVDVLIFISGERSSFSF